MFWNEESLLDSGTQKYEVGKTPAQIYQMKGGEGEDLLDKIEEIYSF